MESARSCEAASRKLRRLVSGKAATDLLLGVLTGCGGMVTHTERCTVVRARLYTMGHKLPEPEVRVPWEDRSQKRLLSRLADSASCRVQNSNGQLDHFCLSFSGLHAFVLRVPLSDNVMSVTSAVELEQLQAELRSARGAFDRWALSTVSVADQLRESHLCSIADLRGRHCLAESCCLYTPCHCQRVLMSR